MSLGLSEVEDARSQQSVSGFRSRFGTCHCRKSIKDRMPFKLHEVVPSMI